MCVIGVDIDDTIARWPPNPDDWEGMTLLDVTPYEGSQEVLHSWVSLGVQPVYITFRSGPNSPSLTHQWLKDNGYPPGVGVWFGNEFAFKDEVLRLFPDVLGHLDDDVWVCNAMQRKGFRAFCHDFGGNNPPIAALNKEITVWREWSEIDQVIRDIIKEDI